MVIGRSISALIALLLQATLSTAAIAADWTMDTVASLKAEYNDNRRLTTFEEGSVVGRILDLKTTITAESEVSETKIKPRFTFDRYTSKGTSNGTSQEAGAEQLDSNNQFLDMSTSYITEASRWTINANYTRDNTLTSELEETGLVQTNRRRKKWNIDPQWTQELTDWTIFNFRVSNSSVTYEDAATTGLVDYDVKSVNAVISHNLAESTTLNATLYGSRLEAAAVGNETDTLGLSVGIDYKNQELMNWALQIGMRQSDYKLDLSPLSVIKEAVIKESEDGYTADVSLSKVYEFTHWTLNLNRAVLPSGVGRLIQRDRVVIRNMYELSSSLQSNISLTALQNKEIQQNITAQDRDYQSAVVSLNWNIMSDWSLNSAFTYRKSKFETRAADATSNALQLTIIYTGL